MDPLANPDAIVTLTVNRYLSVTQGVMVTSGANPDVVADLTLDANRRVTKLSNNAFEVTGSDDQGSRPLDIQFQVLPADAYAAVGLVIKNLHNIDEGNQHLGKPWADVKVGSGTNDNQVTVTDKARKKNTTPSIPYGVYVLIKPKAAAADFPVGDVGVIDPLWTNR